MKIKNIKKTLFIFLVSSFLVLVIIPGTMAIFSEKETATINLNVEAPSFTVTFDGNGGTSSLASKEVEYLNEYGELPTADKCGSNFLGWYTGLDNGIKIEEDSIFDIMNEQTLYARYEDNGSLYDVIKCEALRTDLLEADKMAKAYTGEHQDTMSGVGEQTVYHFYEHYTNSLGSALTKNNVVFANQCWQMIRTTDVGGVKLLYNGEPTINEVDGKLQYDCSTNRPGHIGGIKSTMNLNGTKQYAASYTTSVSGDTTTYTLTDPEEITVSSTDTEETINNIVTNYPYTCGNGNTSCDVLYRVDSRESDTTAYVYKSAVRDSIGGSAYEIDYRYIGAVGYMHNKQYISNRYSNAINEYVISSITLDDSYLNTFNNYYFGDNYTIENNFYVLKMGDGDPVLGSSFENGPEDWVGLYATNYSGTSFDYFSGIDFSGDTPVAYVLFVTRGLYHDDPSYTYVFSDDISDNGDGTFSMEGTVKVLYTKDWYSEKDNVVNKFVCMPGYSSYDSSTGKYICSDNGEQQVGALRYIISTGDRAFNGNPIYKYGNGIESSGNSYKLVGKDNESGTLQYLYNHQSGNNSNCFTSDTDTISDCGYKSLAKSHYTCFNLTGVCDNYYYFHSFGKDTFYGLSLTGGKIVSADITDKNNALYEMLYQDDENGNVNTIDSIIKTKVDEWYKNTLYDDYDDYIEDAIYCAGREIVEFGSWNPNVYTYFDVRFIADSSSTNLYCSNVTDRFSVANQSAKLTYKVGLIDSIETKLLSGNKILVSAGDYYTMSPKDYATTYSHIGYISLAGSSGSLIPNYERNVRPSITLKSSVLYSSGSGSTTDPYIIDTSGD